MDAAAIDGRLFLNRAGFGAYPDMLVHRERPRPWLGRWPSQVVAFIIALVGARPLELTLNGTRRRVWLGFVGNCRCARSRRRPVPPGSASQAQHQPAAREDQERAGAGEQREHLLQRHGPDVRDHCIAALPRSTCSCHSDSLTARSPYSSWRFHQAYGGVCG